MRIFQLTMTGAAQELFPYNPHGRQIYASVLSLQNNGSNPMRVGDNTVTASQGQLISPSGGFYTAPVPPRGSLLPQWWVIGTAGDVLDGLYEDAQ